jgi:hypothetical protein
MSRQLSQLPGLTVYPSQGNFLFVRLPVGAEGTVVRDRLLTEHRILVRECGNKIGSSSRFLRLVVRPQVDVRRLVSGLESVLYGSRRGAAVPELGGNNNYSSGTAAVDRLVSSTNGSGMQGIAAAAQGQGRQQQQQQPQPQLAPVAQSQQQQQPQLAPVAQGRQQQGLLTAGGAMGQGQQGGQQGQWGQQPQQQPMTAMAQAQQQPMTAMAQAQQQAGLSPVGGGQPQQQPGLSPVATNGQPQQEPWLTPVGQFQQQQPGPTPVAQPGRQPMPQPTRWPAAAASRGTPWPEAPANNRVG